jgi:cytochrome c biogenesis protein CcdA
MPTNFIFGISLTGSFLAGTLALFAPCCITFLLPSYLGTVFKKTEKVFFYTLVFSLGLATILVPVALGFKFIVSFFDSFHRGVYYLGAAVLVLMGVMTFWEVKMPFSFSLSQKPRKKVDVASTYSLGLISGLTSSCCAPVLLAAITLTSLSPTVLQAVVVALAYVLGIVFPLFLLAFAYDKISNQFLGEIKNRVYKIFKVLGSLIFLFGGVAIAVLNYQGKIVMGGEAGSSRSLRLLVFNLSKYFQNPVVDLLVFTLIVYVFYRLVRNNGEEVS